MVRVLFILVLVVINLGAAEGQRDLATERLEEIARRADQVRLKQAQANRQYAEGLQRKVDKRAEYLKKEREGFFKNGLLITDYNLNWKIGTVTIKNTESVSRSVKRDDLGIVYSTNTWARPLGLSYVDGSREIFSSYTIKPGESIILAVTYRFYGFYDFAEKVKFKK